MRRLLVLLLFFASTSAFSCKPPYLEYEMQFDSKRAALSSEEIRRLIVWREKTRRALPGGFEAVVELWENNAAGITPSLARRRANFLEGLLKNLGVSAADIEPAAIRQSAREVNSDYDERFLNTGAILLNPRCPHICCDAGDIR